MNNPKGDIDQVLLISEIDLNLVIPKQFVYHVAEWHPYFIEIVLIAINGSCKGRIIQFYDQIERVILDGLHVSKDHRTKGLGLKLQSIRENIAILAAVKESFLSVIIDSWMRKWYESRNYSYHSIDPEKDDHVFLKKELYHEDLVLLEPYEVLQDPEGEWYWIPTDLVKGFKVSNTCLAGLNPSDYPEDFQVFKEKFYKYKCGFDKDNTPLYWS